MKMTRDLTQARAEEAVRRAAPAADGGAYLVTDVAIKMADLIATDWTPEPEVDWATREARKWYAEMHPRCAEECLRGDYDKQVAVRALRAHILALGEPVTADQVKDGEEVLVTYRAVKHEDAAAFLYFVFNRRDSIRRLPKQEGE